MKTLGRILIILVAFAIVMGITYVIVNAGSSSSSRSAPALGAGGGRFSETEGVQPPFSAGERPEFPGGGRPEFDSEGPQGGGWMLGFARNMGIIAIIVALVTVPRRLGRKKTVSAKV